MNVFDFALEMELDGEKYYRDQAEKVKYNDLQLVLEGLADDEQRHYKIIQSAKNDAIQYIEANPSLKKTQNVFVTTNGEIVANSKEFIAKLKDEQSDVYRVALAKEKESVELYKKMQEDSKKPGERIIFQMLVQEEKKHVEVLDTIIEMLNHTNDWVEAAEFNHKDTY